MDIESQILRIDDDIKIMPKDELKKRIKIQKQIIKKLKTEKQ